MSNFLTNNGALCHREEDVCVREKLKAAAQRGRGVGTEEEEGFVLPSGSE